MGTTWNNTSTSAAGVISASMKRVFSFIRRRLPSRPPQHAMARSHVLPGHGVDTSSSGRKQASLVAGRGAVDFLGVFGQHLRYVLALAGERRDRHVRICFVHGRPLREVVGRMRDRRLIEHRMLERREVLVLGCELGPELDVRRRTAGLLPHLDLPDLIAHHRGEHFLGELTFDLKAVLNTLVESAARLCEADTAIICRPKAEFYETVASYGFSPDFYEFMQHHPIPVGPGTVTGRAALEGRTIHVPDVLAEPDYKMSEAQRIGGYRTVLGVPLLREGSPIGVIALSRPIVRPFTEKQIELATTFADQAVIAIENVRLFEAEQQRTRELTEALEQQTATSEILQVISSSPGDLQPVFETILANATRICRAEFGNMFL